MTTITLRSVKGSPLTFVEADNNIINLRDRLVALEAGGSGSVVAIDGVSVDANGNYVFHLSSGASLPAVAPPSATNAALITTNLDFVDEAVQDYILNPTHIGVYLRLSNITSIYVPSDTEKAIGIGSEFHIRIVNNSALLIDKHASVTLHLPPDVTNTAGIGATLFFKKVGVNEWDVAGFLDLAP